MGLQRRKNNQLAEAEAKATAEIAAAAASADPQQRRAQQTPKAPLHVRSPLVSYFLTVALACAFWTLVQTLHKYAHVFSGV
jgi:hypothetical protein